MSRFSLPAWARLPLVLCSLAAVLALGVLGLRHWQTPAASTQAADEDNGVGILLQLADGAVVEGRLVAPAGNNAYEFYLSVLQLEPANVPAQEALQTLLPRAAEDVERSINRLDLDEAARELRLLQDFEATNYALALLDGKLDAQRQLIVRRDEQRASAMQAAASGR